MESPEDVLSFWFPPAMAGDSAGCVPQMEWWFRGGANAEILRRFVPLLERAIAGEIDDWATTARSRLALILVLDQFSRTIFRDSPRAFAQDPKALALAKQGIDIGHYDSLESPWEKTFFQLPLSHSEDVANHEVAVRLTQKIADEAPESLREILRFSAGQARGHRDVVARFGRHPHRNEVLGRPSTADELRYLADGDVIHRRQVRL